VVGAEDGAFRRRTAHAASPRSGRPRTGIVESAILRQNSKRRTTPCASGRYGSDARGAPQRLSQIPPNLELGAEFLSLDAA
jgi:hypothetical protein